MSQGDPGPSAPSFVPFHWDGDPISQVRALRDEVHRQRDFPTPDTQAFMSRAWQALNHLPGNYWPPERVEILTHISRFYYLDGQWDRTVAAAQDAVTAAVEGGHRRLEVQARARLGIGLRESCDYIGSITELVRAVEIAREASDPDAEAKALNSLGNTYSDAGLQNEALTLFERVGSYFESTGDLLSAWMAFDNAALAALRLGDIERGNALAERAKADWSGEPRTADQYLWVVQGALTNCQLLIQADRVEEALERARIARAASEASGVAGAEVLAALTEAITGFAAGVTSFETMDRVIETARKTPNYYWEALDAACRMYERAGHLDRALDVLQRLLEFNRTVKFRELRRFLGRPSAEELQGTARLARLGSEIEQRIADFVDTAINQSLRAGYDHSRIFRVSRLTELFASSVNWPSEQVAWMAIAAKLIDIGSIVIPTDLLTKRRELSVGEREIVAEHARFGASLLSSARLGLLERCAPVVRYHHEQWNGMGPEGLRGEEIPIEARLVALCDVFDALTHERPWRRAHSAETALQLIDSEAGTRFDPGLTLRFVDWLRAQLHGDAGFFVRLGAEASENDYVRARKRLDQLVFDAPA